MKVQELIYLLSKEDPDAEVIIMGEQDFFYPISSIREHTLKKTHVWLHSKLADAYEVAEQGETCIELRIG